MAPEAPDPYFHEGGAEDNMVDPALRGSMADSSPTTTESFSGHSYAWIPAPQHEGSLPFVPLRIRVMVGVPDTASIRFRRPPRNHDVNLEVLEVWRFANTVKETLVSPESGFVSPS